MDLPAIWQTPIANAVIKNGARSFIDGDAVNISYTFLRTVSRVEYVKGISPFGVNANANGLSGTMTRKDPQVPTPPRDYQITVRAWTVADATELNSGYPAEWYEDRTFTVVGGLWYGPPAGALTNTGGVAYKHGDAVNVQFTFDPNRPVALSVIGGTLPPGLAFSNSTRRISGTMGALPKGQTEYPVLLRAAITQAGIAQFQDRAFIFEVNPLDERHGWDTSWLDNELTQLNNPAGFKGTVYQLGTVYRGTNVEIPLKVNNPDNDILEFKATGAVVQLDTWFEGLPEGLHINSEGKILGTPVISDNNAGNYFFRVYARDPQDTEGTPRTSEIVFQLILDPHIQLEQQLNDTVKWLTPAGSLGSTYETFASHFGVSAVPQFNLTALTNEYQTVQYKLIGTSPFPTGVFLEETTGNVVGVMPHVAADITYTFTVRARVVFINKLTGTVRNSTAYSDRVFSFTVRNLYYTDTVCNLYIAVPPFDRREISKWVYGTMPEFKEGDPRAPSILTVLGRDVLFRRDDPSWGRVEQPRILLAAGLITPSPNVMMTALRDYHHAFSLRVGELKWAKGVDPSGNYTYDVLYFSVTDPMKGAGGFDAFGRDDLLPPPTKRAIPKFNMKANSDRYHPMSIDNARKDLINVSNRAPWPDNPQIAETSSMRGIGIPGKEGLPFWMTCEQVKGKQTSVIGYIPAIELAYLKPGKGAQAVKSLVQAGFQTALQGHPIKVDRYLLISDGLILTQFDVSVIDSSMTSFDGPDSDPPTVGYTTFDTSYKPTSKYYKFPPGDV
jgi:hypothetical protein